MAVYGQIELLEVGAALLYLADPRVRKHEGIFSRWMHLKLAQRLAMAIQRGLEDVFAKAMVEFKNLERRRSDQEQRGWMVDIRVVSGLLVFVGTQLKLPERTQLAATSH